MSSSTEGDQRWYAHRDGRNYGPYQRSDIERMIQNGQLQGTDYLQPVGGGGWIKAQDDSRFGQLLSSHVEVGALLPDRPSDNSPASVKVYDAKSGTQWRLALVSLVLGAVGLIALIRIFGWLSGGPRPQGGAIFAAAAALFFLPVGIMSVANALRGLPRLTVTPEGIKLESSLRTKSARWSDLGSFALKTVYSRRSRQVRVASATIIGSGMERRAMRRRTFTIPDHFTVPIDAIAAELNAARAWATGDTAPTAADIAPKDAPIGLAQFTLPWLSFALLAALIIIFTLENMFAATPPVRALSPSIPTLIGFGALSHTLVVSHGQWYRLFTAPFLHANLPHIVGNGIALLWGGWLLERLVGRLWLFAFFSVGALGGSLFSLAVNPVNQISVGASGALMALLAALFVGSFRYASGTARRTRLQLSSLRFLVPSLVPFFQSSSVEHIDYGAHIGGTLSGAALALVLLKYWPESTHIPQLRKTAAAISAIGAVLFAASGSLVIVSYPKFVQALEHARPAAAPAPSAPAPSAPAPSADVLSDHGPKRVACDAKWTTLPSPDPAAYPAFLQKCINGDPTSP